MLSLFLIIVGIRIQTCSKPDPVLKLPGHPVSLPIGHNAVLWDDLLNEKSTINAKISTLNSQKCSPLALWWTLWRKQCALSVLVKGVVWLSTSILYWQLFCVHQVYTNKPSEEFWIFPASEKSFSAFSPENLCFQREHKTGLQVSTSINGFRTIVYLHLHKFYSQIVEMFGR